MEGPVDWSDFTYPIDAYHHVDGDWDFGPTLNEASAGVDAVKTMLDPLHFQKVYHVDYKEGEWTFLVYNTNGYYVYFNASCDTTGFDCQGGGTVCYAQSWKNMYAFGLTDDMREIIPKHANLE